MMKRRHFLYAAGGAGLAARSGLGPLLDDLYAFGDDTSLSWVEARYYKKHADRETECLLCPRLCKLGDKERGYCGVRENREGVYYTLVYGKVCAVHIDPIEKKPFFHFLPESRTFSIAAAGCNVNCRFCQNWEISQVRPEQIKHIDLPPKRVALAAVENRCPVIAYTYTEPVVFFEYMVDSAKTARMHRVKNVVVTGGHINPEPLKELMQHVDAIKIDLKAFSQDFYRTYVRGDLAPVLDAISATAVGSPWLEIVYLVIPSLNDSEEEIRRLSRWLKENAGPDVPLHFSRFHPMYLLKNLPPTPVSTLEKAHQIASSEGLNYVYIGNVPGHKWESTYCSHCREKIIYRKGYQIGSLEIENGMCLHCGMPVPGIWK